MESDEFKIPSVSAIKKLLEPILIRLDNIDGNVQNKATSTSPKYYRNEDLKRLFGLSNNTIIKYRETGILPFTKLGEIYLYEVVKIEKILKDNQI
ncbi:helix-turn-helix domain-containing protein [Flavobacterium sp. AG291]|uniref:helix-turn-helix domain-containing protein n=1 Tax=Flavobacterium sp. AG291 TaxID=2184000 RepID=UPI000E0B11F9|nr:helix-turn-helix domain-containing protein [Flavobacterium sp. AG291]RDI14419.1 hypothetical protein DEU42_102112 [Flavobacterium sp. AG291]